MPRTNGWVVDGLIAGAAQWSAGELAAAVLPRARSPVNAVGRALIDLVPGPAVDMTVATVATADKPLMRASLVAETLGSGVMAMRLEQTRPRLGQTALLVQAALAAGAGASRPETGLASSAVVGAATGAAGAGSLSLLRSSRRSNVRLSIVATSVAAGVAAALIRFRERAALRGRRAAIEIPAAAEPAGYLPDDVGFSVPGLTPLLTPTHDFYVTDTAFPTPEIDPGGWRLRVHGMVRRPLDLSLDDLLRMDLVELDATLVCVHNPIGGDRVGTARWIGVPLRRLLERAGVGPGAEQVLTRSLDGFTAGIPLKLVESGADAIVAVGMNGEPLELKNGFPARMLVPGLWGADANTKFLGEIELTTWAAVEDYWDKRGWPRDPTPVQPGARIDVPTDRSVEHSGPLTVAGVAWAPPHGVVGAEVSIDGQAWVPAELTPELATTAWRQWRFEWNAGPGRHEIRVRAIGRAGAQRASRQPPYPEGATGYHSARVSVIKPGARTAARAVRSSVGGIGADIGRRVRLAAMAPPAWRRHGFPHRPQFPSPQSYRRSPD